jgi:hypothetical protein
MVVYTLFVCTFRTRPFTNFHYFETFMNEIKNDWYQRKSIIFFVMFRSSLTYSMEVFCQNILLILFDCHLGCVIMFQSFFCIVIENLHSIKKIGDEIEAHDADGTRISPRFVTILKSNSFV